MYKKMKGNSQHERQHAESRQRSTRFDNGHGVVNVQITIRHAHDQKAEKVTRNKYYLQKQNMNTQIRRICNQIRITLHNTQNSNRVTV